MSDLIQALNAIGASPRDIIAILQALRAAGALQAELEIGSRVEAGLRAPPPITPLTGLTTNRSQPLRADGSTIVCSARRKACFHASQPNPDPFSVRGRGQVRTDE